MLVVTEHPLCETDDEIKAVVEAAAEPETVIAGDRRQHVLLAEDHPVNQRVVQAILGDSVDLVIVEDGKLNDWGGGRGVYFKDLDGHVLELMTVPQ